MLVKLSVESVYLSTIIIRKGIFNTIKPLIQLS